MNDRRRTNEVKQRAALQRKTGMNARNDEQGAEESATKKTLNPKPNTLAHRSFPRTRSHTMMTKSSAADTPICKL
jgi:hypothetical protein